MTNTDKYHTNLLHIIVIVIICIIIWSAVEIYNDEGFYPRRWNDPQYHGQMWGWRRPWQYDIGNWRPNAYYPAYSGYWKQCPSGGWCPPYKSCMSPECS
uniref:Uncharacterized protein n=1 Tax=viral metagenome TaxID=1070528 RepID=A0A6C0HLD9_9ZZZZ